MVTLALVGAGQWGKNFITTIDTIPNSRLKYVCAESSGTLNALSNKYIKTKYYKDLYKYSDIDGIIIATPGSTHFEIACDFLKRGYNLLIEKPLTTDYQQALQLKEIYKLKKPQVLIGHIYLYDPAFIAMKKLVSEIGEIQYMTFEGLKSPIRSDISILWEWGPHGISVCLDILGQKPIRVSAWVVNKLRSQTELYDVVHIRLEFSNKVFAFIKGSWLSPFKKREIIIVGSKSTIVLDDLASHKVTCFKNMGPFMGKGRFIKSEPEVIYAAFSKDMPLKLEVLEFIKSINKGINPITDLDQALLVTQIIHLAEESILKGGCPVKIK